MRPFAEKCSPHFIIPESASGLLEAYVESSGPLTEFVSNMCDKREDYFSLKDLVYRAYREWADARKLPRSLSEKHHLLS